MNKNNISVSIVFCILLIQNISAQKFQFCDFYENSICDMKGEKVNLYDSVFANRSNYNTAFVIKNGLSGVFSLETGNELIPCKYEKIYSCNEIENIVLIEDQKELFFYDLTSKKQISPNFKSLVNFID